MTSKKFKELDAFSRIVKLCSYSERCSFDLTKRLIKEHYNENEVRLAIIKAKELNILDDGRYARVYINSKLIAGKGLYKIILDLEHKQIDLREVKGWPEEFHADDKEYEIKRALNILKLKPTKAKNVCASSYIRLINRGFSAEIAKRATSLYLKIVSSGGV